MKAVEGRSLELLHASDETSSRSFNVPLFITAINPFLFSQPLLGLDGYRKVPVAVIDGVLVKGAKCYTFKLSFARFQHEICKRKVLQFCISKQQTRLKPV
jgi:hypothetical protein